jgi:hypothetical protein
MLCLPGHFKKKQLYTKKLDTSYCSVEKGGRSYMHVIPLADLL